eukprot:TRINITY_DN25473_c0_g1_i2.p1 TRINITY_DN25473_c0_g1~~TRINITY_DN25473_c0_g1_i2.p1  ORF type:complete len:355 (+),score=76.07 TRINITY_DN25473_c0_g1_i2:49-1113(+)
MTTKYPITEPGLMGSIIDPETNLFIRHRLGCYLAVIYTVSIALVAASAYVPWVRGKMSWVTKATKAEAMKLVVAFPVLAVLSLANTANDLPRFPETWFLQHRLSIMVGLHVVYTAVYCVLKRVFAKHCNLSQVHAATQAANAIRVIVKLGMFAYWVLPGHLQVVLETHPLELTRERYEPTNHVAFTINSLYLWEVMFRELKPVNVVHHGIACLGFVSIAEWQNVLEPARTVLSIPFIGSLIEGFCCLGTMGYRFLPRGKPLQRLMYAMSIFVIFSYNILLIGFLTLVYAYCDLYSFGYGYIGMPAVALFTYPAQMNMAKIYWAMGDKAGAPEEVATTVKVNDAPAVRRRRAARD